MCEFTLDNGVTHHESDYADPDGSKGWLNYPFKQEVVAIRLAKRVICPDTYRIPGERVKGIAIHWIGKATPDEIEAYAAREIMIVQKNKKVMCCCLNLKTGRWLDYMDNLKNPKMPHLIKYDLSIHGM